MSALADQVAVVTGASRGAGRGIACVLGEAGATVYVTGRSVRDGATTHDRPETIDDTADLVTERGGTGVPVPCDHTNDDEVKALFERVKRDHGRLDILVCNAWGGYEPDVFSQWKTSFWKQPLAVWDRMYEAGVRSHMVTAYFGAPMMVNHKRGLIVLTTAKMPEAYVRGGGVMSYDVAKRSMARMAHCMAEDLRKHAVAAVALAPGWMRTEKVLEHFKLDAENWQTNKDLDGTESPEYTGRAVLALATDPEVMERTGGLFEAGELARDYGFTDIDGRLVPPFSEQHPEMFEV